MNPELRRQMMQRQGQNPAMGEQRSQSPNGNGDAPSPKRQRMDGAFNGQVMGPAGRGQAMPGQPGMANQPGMMLQNGMPEGFAAAQMSGLKVCQSAAACEGCPANQWRSRWPMALLRSLQEAPLVTVSLDSWSFAV